MRGPNRVKKTSAEKAASQARRKREKYDKAIALGLPLPGPRPESPVIEAAPSLLIPPESTNGSMLINEATMSDAAALAALAGSGLPRVKAESSMDDGRSGAQGVYNDNSSTQHMHSHTNNWGGDAYAPADRWDHGEGTSSQAHLGVEHGQGNQVNYDNRESNRWDVRGEQQVHSHGQASGGIDNSYAFAYPNQSYVPEGGQGSNMEGGYGTSSATGYNYVPGSDQNVSESSHLAVEDDRDSFSADAIHSYQVERLNDLARYPGTTEPVGNDDFVVEQAHTNNR